MDRSWWSDGSELPTFAVFNFGGHWFERGVELAAGRVAAWPNSSRGPIKAPSSGSIVIASRALSCPYFARLSGDALPLERGPLRLDNAKLVAFLGEEPHTPLDQAVAVALDTLGCLKAEWPLAMGAPVAQ